LEPEFKEIYFQHYPRVKRVAYYIIKNSVAAEDIAQDVFLKLWNKKTELSSIQNMEAYLVQVAKNEAFGYLDTIKKESNALISLQQVDTSTEVTPSTDEFRKALEKGVSMLAPQCRLIFSLSRFEGLDNDEIATYLGISKRTVETQISTALRMLRTDLKPIVWPYSTILFPIAFALIFC
jgi:RNA polymerase sigma-70 factor, ECF subfamily